MKRGRFTLRHRHQQYVVVSEALDSELREKVLAFLKTRKLAAAKMKNEGGGDDDDQRKARYDDRDCYTHWFNAEDQVPALHERLVEIVRDVGNVEWPLLKVGPTGKVICEYEETQYTMYGPNQHFKAWHQDAYAEGHDIEDARQITLVVMLSNRTDYTEGNFEMRLSPPNKGRRTRKVLRDLDAGDVVVFPAKVLEHRVTPVKTGTRRTLVFWSSDLSSCIYGNPSLEKLAPKKVSAPKTPKNKKKKKKE